MYNAKRRCCIKTTKGGAILLSTNELKAEITRKGETVKSVSSKMGMNRATFYRKMCGVSDFTRAEISQLVEILGLSDTVTMKIFFADEVA